MLEANKLISRRVLDEAFNDERYDVIDEVIAPTFVTHDPIAGDIAGPEGIRALIEGYRSAFPDLHVATEDQLAEDDRVVTRWRARGTHRGELMGIAPTGRQATVTGITIDRIADGKIVESWNAWDALGLLQQLGAVPALAEA